MRSACERERLWPTCGYVEEATEFDDVGDEEQSNDDDQCDLGYFHRWHQSASTISQSFNSA